MAYATSTASSAAKDTWITSEDDAMIFSGDYTDHEHVEDASKPLYAGQASLPPLPVAGLQEVCDVYLQSVKALSSDADYKRTEACVKEFVAPGGMGETLHKRLEERAKKCAGGSWLQKWWNTDSYLTFRASNVVNVSYFFAFADLPSGHRCHDQSTVRAAMLAHGALQLRQHMRKGDDVNSILKIGPGCATPFKYMFNSCRIPVAQADKSIVYGCTKEDSRNEEIVVIRKGHFYLLSATHGAARAWEPLAVEELNERLKQIKHAADARPDQCSIGGMCAANRDHWAASRSRMVAGGSVGNRSFLEAVQRSIFCICLDDSNPLCREDVSRLLWHGDATQRWFDKTIQIVVFENGKAGLVGEHSQFDGLPMSALANFMLAKERASVGAHFSMLDSTVTQGASRVVPVCISDLLQLTPASQWDLSCALGEFRSLVQRHDLTCFTHYGVHKSAVKGFGCSPDAFVQMAIQLAYKRMFGTCRATYEPCSMRRYRHGRTECVRVVSEESQKFVSAMDSRTATKEERINTLRSACNAHVAYIRKALQGKACDRQLMAYTYLLRDGEAMPDIFRDANYGASKTWHLSTSNLSNDLFDSWGWGEVVPDGLGIAYSTNSDCIRFTVTSGRGFTRGFCQQLETALQDMVRVFLQPSSKL
eukprot:g4559.t1